MKLELKYLSLVFVVILSGIFTTNSYAQDCLDFTQLIGKETEFNDNTQYASGSVLNSNGGLKLIKPFISSAVANQGQTMFTSITNAAIDFTGYLTLNVAASSLQCKALVLRIEADRIIVDQDTIVLDGGETYPINFGKGYKVEKRSDTLAILGHFNNVTLNGGFGKVYAACLTSCPDFVNCKPEFNFQIVDRLVTFTNASDLPLKDADFFAWELGTGIVSSEESPVHDFAPGNHSVCLKVEKASCLTPVMKICKNVFIAEEIICELDFSYEITEQGVHFKNTSTFPLTTAETDDLLWSFGDGDVSSDNDPSKFYDAGVYEACLEATNEKCDVQEEVTACKRIVVKGQQVGEKTLIPNEDGQLDDVFVEAGSKIYDRTGYLVVELIEDVNWTGVGSSNQPLPMGVYTVVTPDGEKYNVTIIR